MARRSGQALVRGSALQGSVPARGKVNVAMGRSAPEAGRPSAPVLSDPAAVKADGPTRRPASSPRGRLARGVVSSGRKAADRERVQGRLAGRARASALRLTDSGAARAAKPPARSEAAVLAAEACSAAGVAGAPVAVAEGDVGVAEGAVGGDVSVKDRIRKLIRPLLLAAALAWSTGSPAESTSQTRFQSPDEAVAALVGALQADDRDTLARILGPGSENLVRSGDPVKDRQEAQRFLDAYAERHALVADGQDRLSLQVGGNDWPLPMPLVRRDGEWVFDSQAGAQEIVDRRIGRNEIAAIRFALAYVDAQHAYFDLFKQATGKGRYAMRLVSTEGNYDGLYWPPAPGIPESPLGPLVESAVEEGYPGQSEAGKLIPYQGYYYRILTAQGPNALGGAKSYVQGGLMTGGFGLIAWPAMFGASGVMTFVVGEDGTVFQKDLGPETNARAAAIRTFDPGLDWARITVSGPDIGSR